MRRVMMGTAVVAVTTLLEAVRNRLLLVGLLFVVILTAASVSVAAVSVFEHTRLIVDVGLAAASAIGAIMALTLSITSFAGELRRRTAYPVLARPLPRGAFVAGKFLGVLAAMAIVASIMIAATAVIIRLYGDAVPAALWACWWLNLVELAVVCALATLFSTLAGPVMASAYTATLLIAANLSQDLASLADRVAADGDSAAAALLRLGYYLLPDLQRLSLRTQAANALPIPPEYLAGATLYGLSYATAAVLLAMMIFSRRRVL